MKKRLGEYVTGTEDLHVQDFFGGLLIGNNIIVAVTYLQTWIELKLKNEVKTTHLLCINATTLPNSSLK